MPQVIIDYEETNYDGLETGQQELLDQAEAMLVRAYKPYSGFLVATTVRTPSGEVFSGCNIENASYGLTVCAERTAIFKGVSEGYRQFSQGAVICKGEDFDTQEPTGSCGACAQVMREFSDPEDPMQLIFSTTKKDKIWLGSCTDLLPLGFGPQDLGIDPTR